MNNTDVPKDRKVTIGSYAALAFAVVFFSGMMQSNEWYGIFDFTTLNGSFGQIISSVETADGIETVSTHFRGKGGNGARDGFMFALSLVPTIMFALGVIQVLEHLGALDAARKLLSPILKPVIGIPGDSGLALIASLQSTDAGGSMTRNLLDNGNLTKKEGDVFTMFQFSAGATITNFFASGAILFTLTNSDGSPAVPVSIGLCLMVQFVLKIFGANLMRLYIRLLERKNKSVVTSEGAA